ncbi:transport system permease protein [Lawsonibacter asaccharolyticus]|nr:transport system permease protein [Lawsonibacter asaccharolyticus]
MKSLPTSYTAARKWGIILLLALASLGAALLSMSFGSTQVPFSEILTALMGGETQAYNIVVYARLPRTLAALLCGSALAVGGSSSRECWATPWRGPISSG